MPAKPIKYTWEWRLPATPAALWPLASDTNRFNRDAGVPMVEESAGVSPGTKRVRLRRYGVLIEWDEEPFEWVRPRSFGVVRRYVSGPVREMHVLATLTADGPDHTLLRYEVTATPRNPLGAAAIPFEIGLISARRFRAVFERYAVEAGAAARPTLPAYTQAQVELMPSAARLAPGGADRLQRARTELATHFPADLVAKLVEVVTRGDDLTVHRIRPYVLAGSWHERRRTVLNLCLHATRAGILDLQWDVLCPLCRGAKQTADTLRGISQPVHCDACNIDFNANFEQQVELTFRPNPAIRPVGAVAYCVGGPQVTPHIVAQAMVAPGTIHEFEVKLEAGKYRKRGVGVDGGELFDVSEPGSRAIAFENRGEHRTLMLLERMTWNDDAATAAEVIALQEFRDLFSAEALRPGEAISVGSMTILFTDLLDSTRLYRLMGDAPAFGRVMDHFSVLRAAMEEEEGALVKTIGDAVMAVFRSPAAAIRTVLRAQKVFASMPAGITRDDLKAGIHFGPCIAVTLNDRLDYFGSTVNIAARLDGLAAGGEIVISDAVIADPEVRRMLGKGEIVAVPFEAQLKGLEDTRVQLLRVRAPQEG